MLSEITLSRGKQTIFFKYARTHSVQSAASRFSTDALSSSSVASQTQDDEPAAAMT